MMMVKIYVCSWVLLLSLFGCIKQSNKNVQEGKEIVSVSKEDEQNVLKIAEKWVALEAEKYLFETYTSNPNDSSKMLIEHGQAQKYSREETTDEIRYSANIGDNAYSISKNQFLKGDLDGDSREDILVAVTVEFGNNGTYTNEYLFLNKKSGFVLANVFSPNEIASKNIKDKKLLYAHGIFSKIEENCIIGSSNYSGENDELCCPSYYCEIQKYRYNEKTKKLELVFQSEIKKRPMKGEK